jgi:hypothetical protein
MKLVVSPELIAAAHEKAAILTDLINEPRNYHKQSRTRMLTIAAIYYICRGDKGLSVRDALADAFRGAIAYQNIGSAGSRAARSLWWREEHLASIVTELGGVYTGPKLAKPYTRKQWTGYTAQATQAGIAQAANTNIEPVFKATIERDHSIGTSKINKNMRIIDRRSHVSTHHMGEPEHSRSALYRRQAGIIEEVEPEREKDQYGRIMPPVTLARLKFMERG